MEALWCLRGPPPPPRPGRWALSSGCRCGGRDAAFCLRPPRMSPPRREGRAGRRGGCRPSPSFWWSFRPPRARRGAQRDPADAALLAGSAEDAVGSGPLLPRPGLIGNAVRTQVENAPCSGLRGRNGAVPPAAPSRRDAGLCVRLGLAFLWPPPSTPSLFFFFPLFFFYFFLPHPQKESEAKLSDGLGKSLTTCDTMTPARCWPPPARCRAAVTAEPRPGPRSAEPISAVRRDRWQRPGGEPSRGTRPVSKPRQGERTNGKERERERYAYIYLIHIQLRSVPQVATKHGLCSKHPHLWQQSGLSQ